MAGPMRSRPLAICAVLGVVFGLLLIPVQMASTMLLIVTPTAGFATVGVWMVPPLVASGLLRRPSAGLLSSAIAGLVLVPVTPAWWPGLVNGLLYGILGELVVLVFTRYRFWRPQRFILGGAAAGAAIAAATYQSYGLYELDVATQVSRLSVQVLSGAVFGLLSYLVTHWLASAALVGEATTPTRGAR